MANHEIPKLGRLTPVDIRSVWTSEPYAFDPWLTQPENLQFLADSLGLPGLEVIDVQAAVGPFYADIVAQIVGTDHKVIIENQLDKADHRHLGQVLTYAPKFDARVCVWVAAQICEEHRAAVDWLNRITGEGHAFFAVEVRAVRIGDSQPAPIFEVVAKPNDFARLVSQASYDSGDPSEAAKSNLEYWPLVNAALKEAGLPTRRASKALKDATYWIPIAGSQAYYWVYRSVSQSPYVKVGVTFYGEPGFAAWNGLRGEEPSIAAAFGEELEWLANKQETAWSIHANPRLGSTDEGDWRDQVEWIVDKISRFEGSIGQQARELIKQARNAEEQSISGPSLN